MAAIIRVAAAFFCLVVCLPQLSFGHPLPDTKITVTRAGADLKMDIVLPVTDLLLALPGKPKDIVAVLKDSDSVLRDYFKNHLRVEQAGIRKTIDIGTIYLGSAENQFVGTYQVLNVAVRVADAGEQVTMFYDAIMHQLPNHSAEVTQLGQETVMISPDLKHKTVSAIALIVP